MGGHSRALFPPRAVGERRVALIGLGIVMLMQPFAMALFTWSFVTILAGTAMFVVVSHFPE